MVENLGGRVRPMQESAPFVFAPVVFVYFLFKRKYPQKKYESKVEKLQLARVPVNLFVSTGLSSCPEETKGPD